jgi:putative spermidine/putrescine transport system ATP-binding protein
MSDVVLKGVSRLYGQQAVVDRLDLQVRQGEFLTLLGPSGCGKTTTLRMVAGFVAPSAGRVLIGGEDVTERPPRLRNVGMVFQDYALFPHMTVFDNIAFGLVERKVDRDRIAPRVRALLELIRLPEVADRLPSQLSGGQQQRVALARAIAFAPQVLLLDEPLGALDLKMREHMQGEVRRIQQELGLTALYVTHDQTEAMTMSDRIAVMSAGRIDQLDAPERLYERPATRFVAEFVGKVNFLAVQSARPAGDRVEVSTAEGPLLAPAQDTPAPSTLAVRPENLRLDADGGATPAADAARNRLQATVEASTFSGSLRHLRVRTARGTSWLVELAAGQPAPQPGDAVVVSWPVRQTVLIP